MTIDKEIVTEIKDAFSKMQTQDDFLTLLNRVKLILYGENAIPFVIKQIKYYSNPKPGQVKYQEFRIRKKSGAERTIHAPVSGLKALQKTIAFILQCVYEPHEAAMGFVRGRSIVDNAKIHVNKRYVYNIDLKDFFPGIDQARVWKCLQLKPFLLVDRNVIFETMSLRDAVNEIKPIESSLIRTSKGVFLQLKTQEDDKTYQISIRFDKSVDTAKIFSDKGNSPLDVLEIGEKQIGDSAYSSIYYKGEALSRMKGSETSRLRLANSIAAICCTELEVERKADAGQWVKVKRNVLPQGAPTSPILSNIVCQKLDYLLTGVAKRFGLSYTRYADDITFSSNHNVYQPESDFLKELHRIISEQNFTIKESKTRLHKDGYRKEVTGLLVNDKVNVQKRYIKELRMWLYYWERYGYERAYNYFLPRYKADKGHIKKGRPDLVNVISGKLDYLKMVIGNDNKLYLKLAMRYENLTHSITSNGKVIIDNNNTQSNKKEISHEISTTPSALLNNSQANGLRQKITIPINHYPKDLVKLLKNFSINDSPLKYTTHSWDAGRDAKMFKDLTEFLSLAQNQYNGFSYRLKRLSENLNGKIYNFLFNRDISKTGWGDPNPKKRIYFGWNSPELLEACSQDQSLNPEDFILPEQYQIQRNGKTLQKFKHVIDVFKNEIEIRDENSALIKLLLHEKHDNFLVSFSEPNIINLENKTFYTDVQWFSKALDSIFDNIQCRPQHRQVTYSLVDKEDAYILEILHHDSFNLGKSINDEKLTLIKGNFGDIAKYLMNLCDWSIESRFSEGSYRINYLSSDNTIPPYEEIANAMGFKHILTFYK